MGTEKGYIGNTNKSLIQLGGRNGVQDQFFERFTRETPEIPIPYTPTFCNDWIRSGVSASYTEDSGSILYAMEACSAWADSNLAIPKVALKVKNIGNATASFEFSYNKARTTDWTYLIQPKEWGKKTTGQAGPILSYQTYRWTFYRYLNNNLRLYEGSSHAWTDPATSTTNDIYSAMFYGNRMHVAKNGVVVHTAADNLDSFDDDYMLIVHGLIGTSYVSSKTGGEHPWIWNTKVTGITKPWSFEREFKTQFQNLKPGYAMDIDYSGTGLNYYITGSNEDDWPQWESYLGNYFIGTYSVASWNGGFTFGSSPTVSSSFTGSGTGAIYKWRVPSNTHAGAGMQVGSMMHGYDFDPPFSPAAASNYNQLEPGFYIAGGKRSTSPYYAGSPKTGWVRGTLWLMESGSTFAVLMTGSAWSSRSYSGEEGQTSYLFTKFENEFGQSSMPWGWSNDYMISGAYPSYSPGESAVAGMALAGGRPFITNIEIGTDI